MVIETFLYSQDKGLRKTEHFCYKSHPGIRIMINPRIISRIRFLRLFVKRPI